MSDFSGDADTVVQVGTVHGGLRLWGKGHDLPSPRQLPAAPAGFVDRSTEVQAMDGLLAAPGPGDSSGERGAPVYALSGAPGVGKTALALHWAHQVRDRFSDGDLYADLQGYGPSAPVPPLRVLNTFLRALGLPAEAIPETVGECAALFRTLVNGKRLLLLIDNASSSAQVRSLLPASKECLTIVTSRSALPGLVTREGALRVTLDVLPPAESVELLAQLIGRSRVEAEPSMASRIAELCGHLPLTLRIVGERSSDRPGLSLADISDEIITEQNRLDALASSEDELSDARAVFSWSYRALSSELQASFRRLGLHVGPDIGVHAAAALAGTTVPAARRQLRELADVHLVQEEGSRFQMHDLLRSYARELAESEDSQEDRTQTVRRGLTWYLLSTDAARKSALPHSAAVPLVPAEGFEPVREFRNSAEATRWFETERANLLAALQQSMAYGQFDIVWKLATATSGLLELQSYWTDWEDGMRLGLRAARTLGDTYGQAISNLLLADAIWRAGRLDEAVASYQEAARLAEEISAGWMHGFAFRGLGLLREEGGDTAAAQHYFEQALQVFRSAAHRRGEGMSLMSLGKCARALGDLPRSLDLLDQALEVLAEIDDRWTVAFVKLPLAATLTEAGRPDEAMAQLREAAETFAAFKDRHSEASALDSLAETLHDTGGTAEALRYWRRAMALYVSLANPRAQELEHRINSLASQPSPGEHDADQR